MKLSRRLALLEQLGIPLDMPAALPKAQAVASKDEPELGKIYRCAEILPVAPVSPFTTLLKRSNKVEYARQCHAQLPCSLLEYARQCRMRRSSRQRRNAGGVK